jgi:hypothetical protein
MGPTMERADYDARVLGGSEFVIRLRQEESLRERLRPAASLAALMDRVSRGSLRADHTVRAQEKPRALDRRGPWAGVSRGRRQTGLSNFGDCHASALGPSRSEHGRPPRCESHGPAAHGTVFWRLIAQ